MMRVLVLGTLLFGIAFCVRSSLASILLMKRELVAFSLTVIWLSVFFVSISPYLSVLLWSYFSNNTPQQ